MIYLDHHATTPLDLRVLDAMMPYLTGKFGNASSTDHPYGHEASVAVESARGAVSKAVGARHDEIVFTGGATESDNLALVGGMQRNADRGDHLVTCAAEHHAVLDTAKYLESIGKQVTYLQVDKHGEVDLDELEETITDRTVMVSIMAANNEVGTIADLSGISRITRRKGVLFHTDAAQAVGHIPIDVNVMNIDLMSISAHKMYGPKGVGALYMRGIKPRVRLSPIVHGGGQERNLRSGTLNVPGIVGFGKAAEIAVMEMASENQRLSMWANKMIKAFESLGGRLNGHPTRRLPYNINISFPGIEGKAIINAVSDRLAISAGSACTTQTVEPSHVLLAMGHNEEYAHSSIRIGLGRQTTEEDVGYCMDEISRTVRNLRRITA